MFHMFIQEDPFKRPDFEDKLRSRQSPEFISFKADSGDSVPTSTSSSSSSREDSPSYAPL